MIPDYAYVQNQSLESLENHNDKKAFINPSLTKRWVAGFAWTKPLIGEGNMIFTEYLINSQISLGLNYLYLNERGMPFFGHTSKFETYSTDLEVKWFPFNGTFNVSSSLGYQNHIDSDNFCAATDKNSKSIFQNESGLTSSITRMNTINISLGFGNRWYFSNKNYSADAFLGVRYLNFSYPLYTDIELKKKEGTFLVTSIEAGIVF
jgi:hypothetical protein